MVFLETGGVSQTAMQEDAGPDNPSAVSDSTPSQNSDRERFESPAVQVNTKRTRSSQTAVQISADMERPREAMMCLEGLYSEPS